MTAVKDAARRFTRLFAAPQNVFLLLGSFFGLLMVFITPPALVGDEPNHFFRAYQLSDGIIFGTKTENECGGWIPRSAFIANRKLVGEIEMNHHIKFDTNLIWELRRVPLDAEDKVFVHFPNTVIYTPIPYVPQILGIFAGKASGASAIGMIYLTRIFNLIFFLALSYFAIKKTPIFKWVFCFLWLTPTTIFQAASASVDAFTFGICFVVVAHFLFYAFDGKSEVGKWEIAKIFVFCFLAALCKQAYVFLPLLFLIVPRRKFKSSAVYFATFFALVAVCFVGVGGWSYLVKPIYMPYRGDIEINPDAQMAFVLQHPFYFLKIIVTSYINYSPYYFLTFFGQLTWLDLFVPRWLTIYLFVVLMGIVLLDKNAAVKISALNKTIFSIIIVLTALVVAALLYLTWSPIGGDRIAGIQGRYFIPVAPLFFLLFYNQRLRSKFFDRYVHVIVLLTVTFSLIITLGSIISRYYI